MKNVLIIGCGLLGSSILRRASKKRLAKNFFVYEKSERNIKKIRKLKLPVIFVKKLKDAVSKSELIIFCTPMSEYKKIILKLIITWHQKILLQMLAHQNWESLK